MQATGTRPECFAKELEDAVYLRARQKQQIYSCKVLAPVGLLLCIFRN